MEIIFATKVGALFKLKVRREDSFEALYLENIAKFISAGQDTHNTKANNSTGSIQRLCLQRHEATTLQSSFQKPTKDSIYHTIKAIGSGSFGTVSKVVDLSSGFVYAAKTFDCNISKQDAKQEVGLLKMLSHVSTRHFPRKALSSSVIAPHCSIHKFPSTTR